MVGTDKITRDEPISMTNQVNEEFYQSEDQTFMQIMQLIFDLMVQALMQLPVTAYISFTMSILFMILWLNPFGQKSARKIPVSKQKERK